MGTRGVAWALATGSALVFGKLQALFEYLAKQGREQRLRLRGQNRSCSHKLFGLWRGCLLFPHQLFMAVTLF